MKSTKLPPPPLPPPLLLFLTFLLTFSLLPTAAPADANPTDAAALAALKIALPGRWNTSTSNACNWQGVVCNPQGRVIELHLPGIGFMGRIPNNVLGNLSSLNFLSLRYNALSGNIPSDFASLSQLRYLYLQHNNLSGEIPAVLFSMKNLFRLDLAGNRFSGGIPLGFNNLTNLATLYLQSNQLTGSIPDLKIANLRDFNVSHNLLTGSIPSQFCKMPSSAFEGNSLSACAASGPSAAPTGSDGGDDVGEKKKKKLSAGAIAGIIIGCVIALIVILLLIFFCCCRRKKTEQQPGTSSVDAVAAGAGAGASAKQSDVETGAADRAAERNGESSGAVAAAVAAAAAKSNAKSGSGIDKTLVFFGSGPRVFDLDDLLRASAEVLGKGNYGTTYKASLDNGVAVAVKRLKDVTATEKEFREKLEEIGRFEHENLVGLRAYHCSANEKLLVYDYFPMGSLSALLHGNRGGGRTPLNWETRSAIALGAARGITYVHSQSSTASHGNIKSSNILLTNSYEARVSDCGLAQLAAIAAPNRVAGYRAPEVTDTRRVSQKADVYSFGIFLLELLTGKAPTHALLNEEGVDLPRWVQSVVREEWAAEVFDMELLRYQNVEEEMVKLLQLAIDCCAQYPDSRPSMGDVTSRIDEICQSTLTSGHDPLADISSDPENTPSKPS